MKLKDLRAKSRTHWRRSVIAVGISLAVIGGSAACSTPAASNPSAEPEETVAEGDPGTIHIAVGAPVSILALPSFAVAEGFFEEEGLDVQVDLVTAAQIPTALAGGTVQFSAAASTGPDSAALEGPIDLLGIYAPRPNMQFLLGDGVDSLEDLKGKTVGVSAPGEIVDILARTALREVGLDPDKDVTIVPLGSFQAVIAGFQTGQVAGSVVSTAPTAAMLLETTPGSSVGYDFSEATPWNYAGLYANSDFTAKYPQATQKFVRALSKAIAAWWDDPEAAQAALVEFTNTETAERDYESDLTVLNKSLEAATAETQLPAFEALQANGHPDLDPETWSDYVDNSFVENLE